MNPVTMLIGVAAIGYGAYTAWARKERPEQFAKLEAMREQWGESGGHLLHVIGYTVVPIVVGLSLIVSGARGGSLF